MSECDMCGINYNAPRITDDGYFAFDFFSLHFCPKCSIEIFEKSMKFKNLSTNSDEMHRYEIEKKRLLKTRYWE